MQTTNVTHDQVGKFYDSSIITRYWSHLKKNQMHVGYWDEAHPYQSDLYEGAVRFTDFMVSLTAVAPDEIFVDIGCGYGVPAVTLAKTKQCRVEGITASSSQQNFAREFARTNGLEHRVRFLVGDAKHLPYEESSFAGGWFFESIFHIGHEAALREARRVLKPGAELLIADFIQTGELRQQEREFLEKQLGISSGIKKDDYPTLLEKTGFRMKEFRDITARTMDVEKRWGIHLEIIDKKEDPFIASLDEKEISFMRDFFSQLHAIGKKAIGYAVVTAVTRP